MTCACRNSLHVSLQVTWAAAYSLQISWALGALHVGMKANHVGLGGPKGNLTSLLAVRERKGFGQGPLSTKKKLGRAAPFMDHFQKENRLFSQKMWTGHMASLEYLSVANAGLFHGVMVVYEIYVSKLWANLALTAIPP